jgi:hypothetical protein
LRLLIYILPPAFVHARARVRGSSYPSLYYLPPFFFTRRKNSERVHARAQTTLINRKLPSEPLLFVGNSNEGRAESAWRLLLLEAAA